MQISPGLIVVVTAAAFLSWIVFSFNELVALRNRVRNSWVEIDVQLKRRHDLIPNLVESVRAYMHHERSVFESVTQARAQAIAAGGDVLQRSAAESLVDGRARQALRSRRELSPTAGGGECTTFAGTTYFYGKPHCLRASVLQR